MQKKKKKHIDKFNWKYFLIIAFTILIIIIIGIVLFKKIFPYYKVVNRVSNVEKYSEKKKDDYKTVGWLKVQGTNIDYPVIFPEGVDLSEIREDFLWTNVDNKKLVNRVNILGHNILNLSTNPLVGEKNHKRFEQLMGFVYYDFAEDNKYVQYTFNDKNYLYKIFSVSFVDEEDIELFHEGDFSKKNNNKYVTKSINDSYFKYDIDVSGDDKIITLLTCTRMLGMRSDIYFKVDARLVRENEGINNYSVKKKNNYKDIEEIMEGGEENEEA